MALQISLSIAQSLPPSLPVSAPSLTAVDRHACHSMSVCRSPGEPGSILLENGCSSCKLNVSRCALSPSLDDI